MRKSSELLGPSAGTDESSSTATAAVANIKSSELNSTVSASTHANDNNFPIQSPILNSPNNRFDGWLTLPKDLWPLIFKLVMSNGSKSAISFAQTCKLFWNIYTPFSPLIHIRSTASKFQRDSIEPNLRRLFDMCFFMSFIQGNNLRPRSRLEMIQAVQTALENKKPLDPESNPVSDLICRLLNWPKANVNLTEEEGKCTLTLYQQFHTSVLSFTKLENTSNIMAETTVDSLTLKAIVQTLENNLNEFIATINEIIFSQIMRDIKSIVFDSNKDRALYQDALDLIRFFTRELASIVPGIGNSQVRKSLTPLIRKIERLSIRPEYRSEARSAMQLLLFFGSLLGVGSVLIGGIVVMAISIPGSLKFKEGIVLVSIAAFILFLTHVLRPIIRNCSMQRFSDNIHRLCPGSGRARVEVLNENSPLLINEASRQIVSPSDIEPEGSDIEQGIFGKK